MVKVWNNEVVSSLLIHAFSSTVNNISLYFLLSKWTIQTIRRFLFLVILNLLVKFIYICKRGGGVERKKIRGGGMVAKRLRTTVLNIRQSFSLIQCFIWRKLICYYMSYQLNFFYNIIGGWLSFFFFLPFKSP